jgi:hypothetical protein
MKILLSNVLWIFYLTFLTILFLTFENLSHILFFAFSPFFPIPPIPNFDNILLLLGGIWMFKPFPNFDRMLFFFGIFGIWILPFPLFPRSSYFMFNIDFSGTFPFTTHTLLFFCSAFDFFGWGVWLPYLGGAFIGSIGFSFGVVSDCVFFHFSTTC